MEERLMTNAELARAARLSEPTIHYLIKGNRRPSPRSAEDLEVVTGIAREAWIWPERWFNPYIESSSRDLPRLEDLRKAILGSLGKK
jgi:hypothetical protein